MRQPTWLRVLTVIAATTLVALLRYLLDPWLAEHLPFLIFTLAVAASTRWAGWQAGAATIVTSALVGTYFFTAPRLAWAIDLDALIEIVTFILVAASIVVLIEKEVRLRERVQHEHAQRLHAERELDTARRLESIGLLAGGVAHDFNNLLTVILGSVELLRAKSPGDSRLNAISQSATQAAELVKQLLRFARREPVQVKPLAVDAAIREGEPLLRRLLPEDVSLMFSLHAKGWYLAGDAVQFQQVLQNLVTNARDGMPRGGTVSIQTDDLYLSSEFTNEHPEVRSGEYVHLRVSDTGDGLTEEMCAHVFEPFFSTKAKGGGTGLGLAVVYGIVKQAQGHIFVRSTVGAGTTFDVYWPRVTSGLPRAVAAPTSEEPRTSARLRILLVDDDEAVLRVTEAMLRAMGHEVRAHLGPAAALRALSSSNEPIDVLVTDVVMPWMNGKELAGQVMQLRPGTPVIFISGYNDDLVFKRGIDEPGMALVRKPFSARELESALTSIARGSPRAEGASRDSEATPSRPPRLFN